MVRFEALHFGAIGCHFCPHEDERPAFYITSQSHIMHLFLLVGIPFATARASHKTASA